MADNKKSFILYCDTIHTFEELEDAEAGRLIKHILRYVNDQNPDAPDKLTKIAFEPIKQQLKRDLVAWENKKDVLSESGKKGGIKSGEARRKQKEAKRSHPSKNEATLQKTKPPEANEAVNVNVTVNDTYSLYTNGVSKYLKEEFIERKITEISEVKYFDMVVIEMNKIWMKYKSEYSFLEEADYPALLRIAYLIAGRKKISKYESVHGKQDEILKSFEKISEFMSNTQSKFYRKLPLSGIANPKNFQSIEEEMRTANQSDNQKQLEKERILPVDYFTK